MALTTELEQFRQEFLAKFPKEKAAIMARADADLAERQVTKNALKTGDSVPDFLLPDATGKNISLYESLEQGPVILIFNRGGWCPYCNLELRAYQRLLPELRNAGGQLIAISPHSPDESLATQEKNTLAFPVLSDVKVEAAKAFGLLFTLPDYLQELYSTLGNDLTKFNSVGEWVLPVPASYVIGQDRRIITHHVEIDYRQRMEPIKALDMLMKHQRKHAA